MYLLSEAQFKNEIFLRRIDLYIPDFIKLYWKIQVSKISENDFCIMNES